MMFEPGTTLKWTTINPSGFAGSVGPVEIAHQEAPEPVWLARIHIEQKHMNLGGVCHGGVLLSLADIAMGTGAYSAGGMRACATIQLDSQFISAAKLGQCVIAYAKQRRGTKDISFMTCEIWGGGRQVLTANGVWKFLSIDKPA